MKENKSKLRQMEALELMEEYRELDKSHKKMRKALYHQLEEIGKGTVGLISSGTKLTGEIACMTGAGAVAGAALLGTASTVGIVNGGYSLAREVRHRFMGLHANWQELQIIKKLPEMTWQL